ncbi:exo-beta-N-acetylmuramidase NamZ family protein [Luteibaculum oceani]|uniref:DUF1343 domain-containing protein n=1 Tax=Luteibaculum oceani TaxID=1294296 RepID=A0A5C6VA43_9FLAO|nr:DUF1343 domain-containing protein [Luteibaculum oceani]TXC81614.1 DUF1343 domain-containing protein [Luteibaculum oceani]
MKSFGNKNYRIHFLRTPFNLGLKVAFTTCLFLSLTNFLLGQITVGAEAGYRYLPLLKDKRVAVVVNPTSKIGETHLLTYLAANEVKLQKIFALEHGIYGKEDAGAKVKDGVDPISGLPVISLYGSGKEPNANDLEDVDIIVFDIQDVGARFYTYISSLHYIMLACAKTNTELIVLDRPNPNGHIIDGPVLDLKHKSFVGMHPVPVLHGLTIGEYGLMINGEGWLGDQLVAPITVIPCGNYKVGQHYSLPVPPSPNLPNDKSILLYPHLCFFEGTNVSVGRGTTFPFQVFGAPHFKGYNFSFTPEPMFGAKSPKFKGRKCYGVDLRNYPASDLKGLNLNWLLEAYQSKSGNFFNNFFVKLAGVDYLQKAIEEGKSAKEISAMWNEDVARFKEMSSKYHLYQRKSNHGLKSGND